MNHAKLSPSSSARWLDCTASIKATEQYPNTSNSASEWGSETHYVGELLLKGEDINVGDTLKEGNSPEFTVDEEQLECALDYVNYVRELLDEDEIVLIEEKFDLGFIAPETFGTSDATVLNDTTLHVVDLKTGHNIVMAERNTQLMLYALGALHKLEDDYYIDEVTLHIVQTRAGHIDKWTCDVDELLEFEEFAKAQAKKILDDEVTFNPTPKACKWCDHNANCEALAKFTEEIITGDFDDLENIDGKANIIPNAHIKRILDNKDLITSFIKAVEQEALYKLEHGEEIEGYKLVATQTRRAWDKENFEDIEKYLKRRLKLSGAYKQTLITPTQAGKALGKDAKFIEKWITKPEGKPVVAPISDKRQALNAIVDDFEEL